MELEQAIIVYAIATSITIIYLILRTRYIQNSFEKHIKALRNNILSEEIDILIQIKETVETIHDIQTDLKKVEEDSLKRDIKLLKVLK